MNATSGLKHTREH